MILKVSMKPLNLSSWWRRECDLWPFDQREMAFGGVLIGAWLVYALIVAVGR